MHPKSHITPILVVLFLLTALFSTNACAASVKERMKARVPAINSLKDQKIVGENSSGYLQYLSGNQPQKDLVNAENNDRTEVYTAIAKKEGASVADVGKSAARSFVQRGEKGHMFQSPSGQWVQK